MRLSKRAEYGLRAVVQLAKLELRKYVQANDLATGQEKLPGNFLEAVLLSLRRDGFLESKIGSKGGYRLSRHPRDISIGDLIRRLEGRLTITQEITSGDQSQGQVAYHLLNQKLTVALDAALDALTLDQLITQIDQALKQQEDIYFI